MIAHYCPGKTRALTPQNAGACDGKFPSVEVACETVVQLTGSTRPDSERVNAYDLVYPLYRELYPALTSTL